MTSAHSVVALVGSPYQALCLLEYVREHRISRGMVLVPRVASHAMLHPTLTVLAHLRGFTFHLHRPSGFLRPGPTTDVDARGNVELIRAEVEPATFIIGDYRDTQAWRTAHLLGFRGSDVVVLDDGSSTLAIDRSAGGFAPLEWSEEAERDGFMPMPGVTFFTTMADSLRHGTEDAVVANKWPWLRARHQDLPRSSSLALVIGQGFSRVKLTDESYELELAHRLIATARNLHPECHPLYVAHRGESVTKLATLAETCDVVRFDVPLELVPVQARLLPTGVVGHYSTAITSFAELVPADLPIHAQRIDTARLLSRGDYVDEVYERLESRWSGRITVID